MNRRVDYAPSHRRQTDHVTRNGLNRAATTNPPLCGPRDGRRGDDDVPGGQAGHRAADGRRLLLRLPSGGAVLRAGPVAHREADAAGRPAEPHIRVPRVPPRRGGGDERLGASEDGDHRGDTRGREDNDVQARQVRGPVRGAARRIDGADSGVQATERRRGILARATRTARCSSASTGRRSSRRTRWTSTSTTSKRPRSATIGCLGGSSISSPSKRRRGRG